MDAISSAVTTGVVVTVGRWAQGKGLEANVVIGGGVYAIMLSAMWNSNPTFASKVGTLVLVTALLVYMVPIVEALGYNKTDLKAFAGSPPKPTTGTRPTP